LGRGDFYLNFLEKIIDNNSLTLKNTNNEVEFFSENCFNEKYFLLQQELKQLILIENNELNFRCSVKNIDTAFSVKLNPSKTLELLFDKNFINKLCEINKKLIKLKSFQIIKRNLINEIKSKEKLFQLNRPYNYLAEQNEEEEDNPQNKNYFIINENFNKIYKIIFYCLNILSEVESYIADFLVYKDYNHLIMNLLNTEIENYSILKTNLSFFADKLLKKLNEDFYFLIEANYENLASFYIKCQVLSEDELDESEPMLLLKKIEQDSKILKRELSSLIKFR